MDGDRLLQKYNELEEQVQKVLAEQPRLEAERELAKREVDKKMQELRDMGVDFKNKGDLQRIYKETLASLTSTLDSLERKLGEYESIRKEVEDMEKKDLEEFDSSLY